MYQVSITITMDRLTAVSANLKVSSKRKLRLTESANGKLLCSVSVPHFYGKESTKNLNSRTLEHISGSMKPMIFFFLAMALSHAEASCSTPAPTPPPPTPPPTPPATPPPPASNPSCDFNTNLCKWQQSKSDQFDWTRRSGRTPSSSTGPSAGHGGRGSYIYIETSWPRRQNDKAILTFKGANSKSVCLSFYYYMYGRDINRLIIYNAGRIIWSKSLEQGIGWKKAEVLINGNFDLKIEGIRGASYRGDIAIDDISVADGSCGGTVPPTPTPGPTVPPGPTKCGVSPMTRVIGGVNAVPGKWPWQIALLRGRSKTFSCGGTLIAPDWIVTAAHCIPFLTGSYYTVRLGEHNRRVKEGTEEEIPGKRVIKHPSYNRPSPLNNDIALIQLARPAKLSARVGTVCLPSHNENVPTSAKCFITGWGKIKHPGSSHHILQQAKLPPVTNDVCAKKLAASPGLSGFKITNQMICAGVEGTILSGCHGDSGGPYVCQSLNRNWVLQGAVSWGSPRCSAAERYTVFARVAQFRNWINQYVRV